jgi:hypothetical protein
VEGAFERPVEAENPFKRLLKPLKGFQKAFKNKGLSKSISNLWKAFRTAFNRPLNSCERHFNRPLKPFERYFKRRLKTFEWGEGNFHHGFTPLPT